MFRRTYVRPVFYANGTPSGTPAPATETPTPSGVIEPATPAETPTPETPATPEVKTVPLAALEAERLKRHETERRLAFLEGQQSAVKQVETPAPAAPKPPDPPDIDDFETVEDFNKATTKYIKEVTKLETKAELLHEFEQRQATERQQQAAQTVAQTHQARMAEFAKADPDIYTIAQDPTLPISGPMVGIIQYSEVGPQLIKYLSENKAEASRIAQLDPIMAAKEMGKLEGKLTTPAVSATPATPTKSISMAPDPITTVGTQGHAEPDPDNEPIGQYMARMNSAQFGGR